LTDRELVNKAAGELISPAVFFPGETRKNVNVEGWAGWAAVDVDDHDYTNIEEDVKQQIGDMEYIIYSTASSTVEKPKFRIVFQLAEFLPADKIRPFWFALNSKLANNGDKQCKDYSRMYYVPGNYTGAYNFFYHNEGAAIDCNQLIAEFPYAEQPSPNFMDRLPEEIREQVIEHRKSNMDKEYIWNSYHDCPFWPNRLALEYQAISDTGWYAKMYQIMVAIAGSALQKGYPIRSSEVADLCKDFDRDNGNWYENRPIKVEADRAIEYAYRR